MSQRVLVAYDWLNVKDGGGELVLYQVLKLYPEADVKVLLYEADRFAQQLAGHKVRASWLRFFPSFVKQRPHLLLPFVRSAVNSIDTTGYDLVVAVSSAWVKNLKLQPKQRCLVYCYSPARMLWDSWPQAMTGRTKSQLAQFYITRLASRLRLWDYYTSQSLQYEFIAISQTVADRIKKFYHRASIIVAPPVIQPPTLALPKQDYWVVVSVLATYKQIDLAIKTCHKRQQKLVIVGDGPDRDRLEEVAAGSPYIRFVGRVTEADKWRWLGQARGFIFCSIEDFGIAPIEALACGTPVIALHDGGLAETIRAGRTGVFFDEPSIGALSAALDKAETTSWDQTCLRRTARRYQPEKFREHWRAAIAHENHK